MANQGGKNRKFGRHGRNPSSKLQATRSARNKARNIAKHGKGSHGHVCPKHPAVEVVVTHPTMMHAVNETEFNGIKCIWHKDRWVEKQSRIPLQGEPRIVTKHGVSVNVVMSA